MRYALAILSLLAFASPLRAEDTPPMDLAAVDQDMLAEFFGVWQVSNADGSRICDVELTREEAIGGFAIELADDCASVFPVMGDVAAWRLLEGWGIVFIDVTRKELIRFTTPDETYVAEPETDGIATIWQTD